MNVHLCKSSGKKIHRRCGASTVSRHSTQDYMLASDAWGVIVDTLPSGTTLGTPAMERLSKSSDQSWSRVQNPPGVSHYELQALPLFSQKSKWPPRLPCSHAPLLITEPFLCADVKFLDTRRPRRTRALTNEEWSVCRNCWWLSGPCSMEERSSAALILAPSLHFAWLIHSDCEPHSDSSHLILSLRMIISDIIFLSPQMMALFVWIIVPALRCLSLISELQYRELLWGEKAESG